MDTAMVTAGGGDTTETLAVTRWPSSLRYLATTLLGTFQDSRVRFPSWRIVSTRAARVILPMSNLNVWRKGWFGMRSIPTQIKTPPNIRLFFCRRQLPASGGRGLPPSTTTTTPTIASTQITRSLALAFFGLNITTSSRTDG